LLAKAVYGFEKMMREKVDTQTTQNERSLQIATTLLDQCKQRAILNRNSFEKHHKLKKNAINFYAYQWQGTRDKTIHEIENVFKKTLQKKIDNSISSAQEIEFPESASSFLLDNIFVRAPGIGAFTYENYAFLNKDTSSDPPESFKGAVIVEIKFSGKLHDLDIININFIDFWSYKEYTSDKTTWSFTSNSAWSYSYYMQELTRSINAFEKCKHTIENAPYLRASVPVSSTIYGIGRKT